MIRGTARILPAMLAAAALLLPHGCGRPPEEELVRRIIKDAAALAQKRDLGALMDLLAPDYRDYQGRDKAAAQALIENYLRSFRGIVIHVLGVKVEITEPGGRAAVRTDMVLSSGAAEAFRKLARFTGDYFRFDLGLEKGPDAGWRISYAEWWSVSLTDLLPESLEALKELFPGL